jgi:hypothetical protein
VVSLRVVPEIDNLVGEKVAEVYEFHVSVFSLV